MQLNDVVNGTFEFGAGLFNLLNVRRILKDKKLDGVSWIPTVFFSLWGLWNLFYYPSLNQPLSFVGGLSIVCVNLLWLYLVWYYGKRNQVSPT
jgi:hypothetical protein